MKKSELKNILSELNLEKSNLGVEYDSYGLTGKNAIDLNNSLTEPLAHLYILDQ